MRFYDLSGGGGAAQLGVTEDMLPGIAKGSFIMKGGYKVLNQEEIIAVLKESMKA